MLKYRWVCGANDYWWFCALVMSACASSPGRSSLIAVPAGHYVVGCVDLPICEMNPRREIDTDGFFIDKLEATHADYARCVSVGVCPRLPAARSNSGPDEVALLSYSEAFEYCRWRGLRLPYDDEWEISARGRDGRVFPWGNEFHDEMIPIPVSVREYHVGIRSYYLAGTTRLGDSPFGIGDLAGTYAEFTKSRAGKVHLRGAPAGFSNDMFDFSAVKLRSPAPDERGAARCVAPR
jgi:formylglycine-generating enzyme required for sulfatase activity